LSPHGPDQTHSATCGRGNEPKKQWQTGYSPRLPTSPYRSQSLHAGWPPVCSSIYQVLLNRPSGFEAVVGRKSPFPITLAIGLYNSLYYRTSRDIHKTSCVKDRNDMWPTAAFAYSFGSRPNNLQLISCGWLNF